VWLWKISLLSLRVIDRYVEGFVCFSWARIDFKRRFKPSRALEGWSMQGYVQVYTGNGKGKTTAALGLAIRAAGAGLRVFICQFMKRGEYSELKALELHGDGIVVEQFGTSRFVIDKITDEDREQAERGLSRVLEILKNGDFDVVILDEINLAVHFGLIQTERVLDLIEGKPPHMELLLTGRMAKKEICDRADLVTEMKEVKHYYEAGVPARLGIEK
jgi:cob(I)alamin adenosyltransferase